MVMLGTLHDFMEILIWLIGDSLGSFFCRLWDMNSRTWLCGGDFNKILAFSEKIGGQDRSVSTTLNFRMELFDCCLGDCSFSGPMTTWINRHGNITNIQEQLDHFVYDDHWWDCFSKATVDHLDFSRSDHCPILMRLEEVE